MFSALVMGRWALASSMTGVVAAMLVLGQALPALVDDETLPGPRRTPTGPGKSGLTTLANAENVPTRRHSAAGSAAGALRARPLALGAADGGSLVCQLIDFEGLADGAPVGTVRGDPDVSFGPAWLALIDADAGGTGNFANEPSADTTAAFLSPLPDPIDFSAPVTEVHVWYSAAASSTPITLTAWDGPGGTGNVVDTALGTTVGTSFDGAPCSGDPLGAFCLWSPLAVIAAGDQIRSVTLGGVSGNAIGFDDLLVCRQPPVFGGCCLDNADGLTTTEPDCTLLGGTWLGDDTIFLGTNLGFAMTGSAGTPRLCSTGTLQPDTSVALRLDRALPFTTTALIIGLSSLEIPFKGGVLVPAPFIIVAGLPVDGSGALAIMANWPAGFPPGFELYFQHWTTDAAGPKNLVASNAQRWTTP